MFALTVRATHVAGGARHTLLERSAGRHSAMLGHTAAAQSGAATVRAFCQGGRFSREHHELSDQCGRSLWGWQGGGR